TMVLLAAFAVLALVLASVGLYGVMALTVTQRTRELGIRMALGAELTNIFKLVLGQGMTLMGIGIAIGLIGAVAAGRALMSLLYNVGAIDAAAVITAVSSLVAVALIACCVPARRATRVDPIIALRAERTRWPNHVHVKRHPFRPSLARHQPCVFRHRKLSAHP